MNDKVDMATVLPYRGQAFRRPDGERADSAVIGDVDQLPWPTPLIDGSSSKFRIRFFRMIFN